MLEFKPFQREGIRQIIASNGVRLLADEMGLGKTVQAIGVINHYRELPVVIICPGSLRLNWAAECEKWLPSELSSKIQIVKKKKTDLAGGIIITSYEIASALTIELLALKPKMVIVDESQAIKNYKAIRTRMIVPICRAAPRKILISGTPILNRPKELWTQLEALNFPTGTFFQFAMKYCAGRREKIGWDKFANKPKYAWNFDGASNTGELNRLLTSRIMTRRLKSEVAPELPTKSRARLVVSGSRGESPEKNYLSLVETCRKALIKSNGDIPLAVSKVFADAEKGANGKTMMFEAYRAACTAKKKDAGEIIAEAGGQAPLVAFFHHQEMGDAIAEALQGRVSFARIDGSTDNDLRERHRLDFQAGKFEVMLMSFAGAVGGTYTRASNMIIAEIPFTPGIALQAEDRIHRIGQVAPVMIRYLTATGTIDQALWSMIVRKSRVVNTVLDGESDLSRLNEVDLQYRSQEAEIVHEILTSLLKGKENE